MKIRRMCGGGVRSAPLLELRPLTSGEWIWDRAGLAFIPRNSTGDWGQVRLPRRLEAIRWWWQHRNGGDPSAGAPLDTPPLIVEASCVHDDHRRFWLLCDDDHWCPIVTDADDLLPRGRVHPSPDDWASLVDIIVWGPTAR